ncbi:MAG: HAD hydrolase-like protein [Rhodospirillales bacterium]|nr:HAD hydrolase-like protein [Alphaproteobacteria bacterium]MCB9987533.1 HAD hydrolase-like protein [Rhodospirillales bacterium]USO07744.1 MAG: HAD hydrolase-like protein [Rhodospirillales bacterium]
MTLVPPALLFDWDNTLIDTFPVIFAGHNTVRRALGEPEWTADQARGIIRLAAKDAFPLWYKDRAREAEQVYVDYVRARHLDTLTVFDGSRDLLRYLHETGIPAGIVSNKRGEFLRAELDALGWSSYFGVVIGADDIDGPAKPDPAGVLMALDRLKLIGDARAAAWFCGDTEADLQAAAAAGVKPVFIENNPMIAPEHLPTLNPHKAFSSPRECLAYLQTLS